MCTKFICCCMLLSLLLTGNRLHAQKTNAVFQYIVDTTLAAHPGATGIVVSIIPDKGQTWTYATGISDKHTKATLQADQPVLMASNTKTYISVAILRLCEEKKLKIEDSIGKYLTKNTLDKLVNDGYKTNEISIVHLLSHTSGIDDYVNDDYFSFVNTHRRYNWTRDEQIDRAVQVGKPLAQPGDTFKYADINYLLLTEIIETVTHQPFYKAVRELLKYKDLKLNATWFTKLEPKPGTTSLPAHQYWSKYPWDSYDLDPSWDLYGGGGIISTATDMALFYKYLFEGKIIKDKYLLSRLYAPVPCKTQTNYCLGLRNITMAGLTGYYHGGFWGTDAIYFPELKTAISIVILERSERELSAGICKGIAEAMKNKANGRS
jgi:D-alanyl-D-alanine carboxypeptidase